MPSAGFELTIPASDLLQSYALDRCDLVLLNSSEQIVLFETGQSASCEPSVRLLLTDGASQPVILPACFLDQFGSLVVRVN